MKKSKEEMLRNLAMAAMEINIRFAPKKYYGPPAPDRNNWKKYPFDSSAEIESYTYFRNKKENGWP